jgi:K+-transporting ATPase KdpF subunit
VIASFESISDVVAAALALAALAYLVAALLKPEKF